MNLDEIERKSLEKNKNGVATSEALKAQEILYNMNSHYYGGVRNYDYIPYGNNDTFDNR